MIAQDSIPTGMEGAKQVFSRAAWMLATALSMCPACISNRQPSMKNPTRAFSVSASMLAGAPSRVRRVLSCFRACMPLCVSKTERKEKKRLRLSALSKEKPEDEIYWASL